MATSHSGAANYHSPYPAPGQPSPILAERKRYETIVREAGMTVE
jgi:hypothetical protein